MKNNQSTYLLVMALMLVIILGSFRREDKLNNRESVSLTDTTAFLVNSTGGWESYNCYFTPIGMDSMELDFLISHGNPLDWRSRQFIGMMSGDIVLPKSEQKITYALLPDNIWSVEIKPNGNCFLKQLVGNTPAGNPVVLPIKIRYKLK